MDQDKRVKSKWPLICSILFHHPDVAKWLIRERPAWLGLARRVAREKWALDVLSRLPEGDDELPRLCGLVGKYAKPLSDLGIPLGSIGGFAEPRFVSSESAGGLDECLHRVGQSLLLVESDDGRALGAVVTIRWPAPEGGRRDVWCGSFLFTLNVGRAKRYPAATPPVLGLNQGQISFGELVVELKEYWVEAGASCTGGQFPKLSGNVRRWEIWPL
jgi:hypothetical protein